MIVKLPSYSASNPGIVISLRCPSCRQQGTFESLNQINDLNYGHFVLGQRRCPNDQCRAHVFFVRESGTLKVAYPAELLDFDSTNVPAAVAKSLEEAIACHAARCFTASAIMVRKTLEELCHDRGATGANLKARISALGAKVTLPQELLEGVDHLRLLGNDAAHIESQTYTQVGQEEVEVGLLFAKELLKAVYQYSALVARLKALQK